MSDDFRTRLEYGKEGQDILIQFLQRHFGYIFEAGEINGEVVNVDFIEELENCEYIPPSNNRGSRLRFIRKNKEVILTMPDVFMSRNSNDSFYWIEVKRHEKYSNKFIVDKSNFDDYEELYKNYTRYKFYAMCLTPEDEFGSSFWDVYWCDLSTLIETKPKKAVSYNGNLVYVWNMREVLSKLNKYPIDIYLYKQ